MAETFNNAELSPITTTEAVIYTAPNNASSDRAVVLSLLITNTDGTNTEAITAKIYDTSGTEKAVIASTIDIAGDSRLELAGSSKIVLKANESIKLTGADATGYSDGFISVIELT
jgi:hypothetical protein